MLPQQPPSAAKTWAGFLSSVYLMARRGHALAALAALTMVAFGTTRATAQVFPLGPERQLETEGCAHSPAAVAALADGGFLAAWTFLHPTGPVHAVQRLDAEFSPGGYHDLGFGLLSGASFAARPGGGIFAVARDQIFALDSSGALADGPVDLAPALRGSITGGEDGPFVLETLGTELRLRRFLPDLTPAGSTSPVVSGMEVRDFALLNVGEALLAIWSEPQLPGIEESRIWAQRIDSSGLTEGPMVLLAAGNGTLLWEAAAHPEFGVGLLWTEYRSSQLWFQTWDPLGGTAPSLPRSVQDTDLRAAAPALTASRSAWVVGWLGPGTDQRGEVRIRQLDPRGEAIGPSQSLSEPMASVFPGQYRFVWALDLAVSRDRLMATWAVFRPHLILPDPCEHYFSPRFREFRLSDPGAVAVPVASPLATFSLFLLLLVSGLVLVRQLR